jgi:hypothetical protein
VLLLLLLLVLAMLWMLLLLAVLLPTFGVIHAVDDVVPALLLPIPAEDSVATFALNVAVGNKAAADAVFSSLAARCVAYCIKWHISCRDGGGGLRKNIWW